LEGNIYDFWSPRDVRKMEQLEGQLNIVGEIPFKKKKMGR
jgi:hypothetical protein